MNKKLQYNNMYYEIIDDTICIIGLISDVETSVTIPEYIDNKPVVKVKDGAFSTVAKNGSLKMLKIYGNVIPRLNENPFLGVPKITIYDKQHQNFKAPKEIYYFGPRNIFQRVYETWNSILPNEDLTKWHTLFNDTFIPTFNTTTEIVDGYKNAFYKSVYDDETGEFVKFDERTKLYEKVSALNPTLEYFEIKKDILLADTNKIDLNGTVQSFQLVIEIYQGTVGNPTGYMNIVPNHKDNINNWDYNNIAIITPKINNSDNYPGNRLCGEWIGRPFFYNILKDGSIRFKIRGADFNIIKSEWGLSIENMPITEDWYLSANGFNSLRIQNGTMDFTPGCVATVYITGIRLREEK